MTGYTAITNVQMSRANSTLLNCILTYFITCKVTTFCYKKTGSYHTGAVINAIITVSYTHLDVYKRQFPIFSTQKI